jgi:hypothetical protein
MKEEFKERTGDITELANTPSFVTQEELKELKVKINKSIEQLVKLVLKAKRDLQAIEERLTVFNTKAGHKI